MKVSAEICPQCDGTGWKSVSRDSDRRVTRCDCRLQARGRALLTSARIPKRYEHCELSNFEFDGPHRLLANARMAACRFVEEYPVENTGLLIIGSIGVGKTHLAVGIIKELVLSKSIACLFYDYRELLKELQASYDPDHPVSEMGVLEPVLKAEVLLIDDIGASKPSPWALDTIGHILNKRYNENRVTLLTTNYLDRAESELAISPAASNHKITAPREETLVDRLGQRVRSRLYEMCRTVEVFAPDYRREIRHAGRIRS